MPRRHAVCAPLPTPRRGATARDRASAHRSDCARLECGSSAARRQAEAMRCRSCSRLTAARAALPDPLDFPGRPRFSLDDDRGLRAARAALRANASWPLRARDGAPAAWPRLRARRARAARGEAPLRVAVLGDSTTFGVGCRRPARVTAALGEPADAPSASTERLRLPRNPACAWPAQLARWLGAWPGAEPARRAARSARKGGTTSRWALSAVLPALVAQARERAVRSPPRTSPLRDPRAARRAGAAARPRRLRLLGQRRRVAGRRGPRDARGAFARALACLASRPAVLFVETERALAHHVERAATRRALLNLTASVGAYMRDARARCVPWKARVWPFSRARARAARERERERERERAARERNDDRNKLKRERRRAVRAFQITHRIRSARGGPASRAERARGAGVPKGARALRAANARGARVRKPRARARPDRRAQWTRPHRGRARSRSATALAEQDAAAPAASLAAAASRRGLGRRRRRARGVRGRAPAAARRRPAGARVRVAAHVCCARARARASSLARADSPNLRSRAPRSYYSARTRARPARARRRRAAAATSRSARRASRARRAHVLRRGRAGQAGLDRARRRARRDRVRGPQALGDEAEAPLPPPRPPGEIVFAVNLTRARRAHARAAATRTTARGGRACGSRATARCAAACAAASRRATRATRVALDALEGARARAAAALAPQARARARPGPASLSLGDGEL